MEFKEFDEKKVDDVYHALCCRLYWVECIGEKCPYYTDKYLPYERCDIGQLREDFKDMINYLKDIPMKRKTTMPNNDYILRSDATTLVSQLPAYHGSEGAWVDQKDALDTLSAIPAADVEPKRKMGRWIDLDDHLLCSSCGASHTKPDKNYCPNCGAKMDTEPSKEAKMTKQEKVIIGLKCHSRNFNEYGCVNCPYNDFSGRETGLICAQYLTLDALTLLKEQEPITPCIRGEEGFSYNDLTRQYGCGLCGKPIDRGDEFCRHCGKAVKQDGDRLNENL